MDLCKLLALGGNSPLLVALEDMGEYEKALKSLRLVSKEVSQTAMLGVKHFTLTLRGGRQDTDVDRASLLRQARLQHLVVRFQVFDPCLLGCHVRTFLLEAGLALQTVTYMDMDLIDTRISTPGSHVLLDAAATLLVSCPNLQTLRCSHGHLSTVFMIELDKRCRMLSTLDIAVAGRADNGYVQWMLQTQLPFLSQINKLILRGNSQRPNLAQYILPDLSKMVNIVLLELRDFSFLPRSNWSFLPPKLRSLHCNQIVSPPPALFINGTASLFMLQSLTLQPFKNIVMSLDVLAHLLQAAPSLKIFQAESSGTDLQNIIRCVVKSTTAADLTVLLGRLNLEYVKNATYSFQAGLGEDEGIPLQPFIARMPLMKGITRCNIINYKPENIGPLLKVFPDLTYLQLKRTDLDNVGLCSVLVCHKLTDLELSSCNFITSMGMTALCMELSTLHTVSCKSSRFLGPASLQSCASLLEADDRVVNFSSV